MDLNFDEEFANAFYVWNEGFDEDMRIEFSNYIETVLLYLCATKGEVSDKFLAYLNMFADEKYTKNEVENLLIIINDLSTDMYYMVPAFLLRMVNNDEIIITEELLSKLNYSISDKLEISVKLDVDEDKDEEVNLLLEALNAIFVITESIGIGYDINPYADPKSQWFLSSFKKYIERLFEIEKSYQNYDILFDEDRKEIITDRLDNFYYFMHDDDVNVEPEYIDEVKGNVDDLKESLSNNYYVSLYIQTYLTYLWSSNEKFSYEMFKFFNIFTENEHTDEEIMELCEVMDGEEFSSIIPFKLIQAINYDRIKDTSISRSTINIIRILFVYALAILDTTSFEALNIIEQATNNFMEICDNNNITIDELGKKMEETSNNAWKKLCDYTIEIEADENGEYEERHGIVKGNTE